MINKYRKHGKRFDNRKKTYLLEFEEGTKKKLINEYLNYFHKNLKYGSEIIVVPSYTKVTIV